LVTAHHIQQKPLVGFLRWVLGLFVSKIEAEP